MTKMIKEKSGQIISFSGGRTSALSSIEDRAIELLRELVRTTPRAFMAASDGKEDWCKRLAEKKAAFTNAEQFLNELNK